LQSFENLTIRHGNKQIYTNRLIFINPNYQQTINEILY